jgi:hypothetical protein
LAPGSAPSTREPASRTTNRPQSWTRVSAACAIPHQSKDGERFAKELASHPVVSPGEVFFRSTAFNVQTNGAPVTLSQLSNGTGQIFVDAVMKIVVKHADGTKYLVNVTG